MNGSAVRVSAESAISSTGTSPHGRRGRRRPPGRRESCGGAHDRFPPVRV